jgi:uncharacterized protein YceK
MTMSVLLLIGLLPGCGTMLSRTGNTSLGAYPYQAVGTDVAVVAVEKPDLKVLALVSIPIDVVLDTLLLPPDLILWVVGRKKDGLDSKF